MPNFVKSIISLFIITVAVFSASVVNAQLQNSENNGASGLTISPVIVEPKIEPGDTYSQVVKLENPLDTTITRYPRVANFTAQDNSGQPNFATTDEENQYGLASWITLSADEITIAPKSRTEFSYTINVPQDADLGGYYAGVLFKSDPGSIDGSAVAVSSEIGQLILLAFGETSEQLAITKFDIPNITSRMPVQITSALENSGNIHVKATGTITIKNMFGQEVAEIAFNEERNNILPKQTREYEYLFEKSGAFGYYSATLNLTYGDGAIALNAESGFWVLSLIPILIGIVIIILIIIIIRSLMKGHDKKVLRQNNPTPPTQNNPPTNPPVV